MSIFFWDRLIWIKFKMNLMKQISIFFLFLLITFVGVVWAEEKTPMLKSEDILTPEERSWLQDHPEVRLSPDPDFLPIESIDESGKYIGIASDYIDLLQKKLKIQFKVLKFKKVHD